VAQANEFRYRYVSLDNPELPPGFTFFFPAAINNSDRVYGTACDDDSCSIAYYRDGVVTVSQARGQANTVNERGTVGGFVVIDPVNFVVQAALFRGDDVELIPPQQGEVFSQVNSLNDRGTALVESDDVSGRINYVLYSRGRSVPFDARPTVRNPVFFNFNSPGSRFINNKGVIAGSAGHTYNGDRGFRFDPRTGEAVLLEPVSPDENAWGLGINNRGDVLGYSFGGSPYHERIGVWDRNGDFKTYFDETISTFGLLFNDNNLIVITLAPSDDSYLVSEPGLRLNLADLVEGIPEGQKLRNITSMNDHGNMMGSGPGGNFLLGRQSADGCEEDGDAEGRD